MSRISILNTYARVERLYLSLRPTQRALITPAAHHELIVDVAHDLFLKLSESIPALPLHVVSCLTQRRVGIFEVPQTQAGLVLAQASHNQATFVTYFNTNLHAVLLQQLRLLTYLHNIRDK